MFAMVLTQIGQPLRRQAWPDRLPGEGELRLRVEACGVCRTDLHLVDGELPDIVPPIVPGHEIVGIVDQVGKGVSRWAIGDRAGVPWLGRTCGACRYCLSDAENLCDAPQFTGYTRHGGYASHVIADAGYCIPLPQDIDPAATAPLLCAGLIGWRCLRKAEDAAVLGLYGFGAAAHIVAQIAVWQGHRVYAFTRPGDGEAQSFARSLGAAWAGDSTQVPPEPLDAAILFAPDGALVPEALHRVRKGGRVICGGIHMSDIPAFAYRLLWEERQLMSVANLTREDARTFFPIARQARVKTSIRRYALEQANEALDDLRAGRVHGAAVLVC